MNRRHFLEFILAASAAAGARSEAGPSAPARSLLAPAAGPAEQLPLWPGPPPGGGGPAGPAVWSRSGSLTQVALPVLSLYRPARPNGSAMLIAAGGGYRHIEMGKEALPAAAWLNSLGITAFVLAYRLPREAWLAGRLAPFQDAQRALRLIRARSGEFGLDPERVGTLGFSAGGHLLGMLATRPAWPTYPPADTIDRQPLRSAANLLIYPIVSLEKPYQHTSTCRVLLDRPQDPREARDWSVQTYVGPQDAPFFLVQAGDDPVSDPANTALLEQACRSQGVAVTRHLFATGGHGFGLGRPGTDTVRWPSIAARWMQQRHFF